LTSTHTAMGHQKTYHNDVYLVVRACLWALLALVAGIDRARHRRAKTQGYQLHRAICVVLGIYLLQEVASLAWTLTGQVSGLALFCYVRRPIGRPASRPRRCKPAGRCREAHITCHRSLDRCTN